MMGKSHLITGTCVLIQAASVLRLDMAKPALDFIKNTCLPVMFPNTESILYMAAIGLPLFLLGNLLPDIDSPNSILGRHVYVPVTHHGITHTLWVLLILTAISLVVYRPLLCLTAGYLVHLIMDSVGAQGVEWLYPVIKYNEYGDARVKKGHVVKLYHASEISETICVWVYIAATALIAAASCSMQSVQWPF